MGAFPGLNVSEFEAGQFGHDHSLEGGDGITVDQAGAFGLFPEDLVFMKEGGEDDPEVPEEGLDDTGYIGPVPEEEVVWFREVEGPPQGSGRFLVLAGIDIPLGYIPLDQFPDDRVHLDQLRLGADHEVYPGGVFRHLG